LSCFYKELFQGFAFFDIEKVQIVIFVGHIIEAKIAGEVFGFEQLFGGANLIVELVQYIEIWKAFWNLITFNWEILVCTISNYLEHTRIVLFENLHWLLSVMNLPHFSR